MSLGELFIGPVGMAASAAHAPRAYATRFSALYFLTMAIGTSLAGSMSQLYDPTSASAETTYLIIMGGVPVSETAAANGLNALMRSIGTSTSAAVMSVVLAHMTMSLGGHELPSEAAFHTAFGISITAAIVAIGLTAAIPMRSKV